MMFSSHDGSFVAK